MVLAFEFLLHWPLEGLEPRRPLGVSRGGRWAGREGDAYVMVVWTLYGSCGWKWERHGVGRENRARVTLNPNIDLSLLFHVWPPGHNTAAIFELRYIFRSCSSLPFFSEFPYWCSTIKGSAKPEAMPISLQTLLSFDAYQVSHPMVAKY